MTALPASETPPLWALAVRQPARVALPAAGAAAETDVSLWRDVLPRPEAPSAETGT